MSKNSQNNLKQYFAVMPRKNLDFLGYIRHWENVQVSSEANEIWLKGFTKEQATSQTVKILPDFQLFEMHEGLLFGLEENVPRRKIISGLLWNSLQKIIAVELPTKNVIQHNNSDGILVKLSPSNIERESFALMVNLENLENQLSNIPEFRQQKLQWTIIEKEVILLGTPFISLPGKTFWNNGNHFLPTGFDFEFPILSQEINYQLNSENTYFVFWNMDGSYFLVDKNNFNSLSISSFRKTKLIL
jgi:hypothetical protein